MKTSSVSEKVDDRIMENLHIKEKKQMRYDAFISYRHSELDMFVAKKIHKSLETFKVPRAVAKKSGKKNIKRVFRDQEELPIGSDLGDNITGALKESEYLLVICSPRTPESYWVEKEINTFIKLHDREHVLAILIEGEPEESFPPQLLVDDYGNPVEPLAADVRGSSNREVAQKIRSEVMRLAAPILHCSYDDLKQRHRERRMKKAMATVSILAALGIAFGAYNAYNNAIIRENYHAKQVNQSKYLAKTALQLLEEGDRQTAALIALEALPSKENDRPYVPAAQYALSQTLHAYDTGNAISMDRNLKHDLPVSEFAFDLTGDRLISKDDGNNIYVWNVADGELLAQIAPEIGDNGYVVNSIGQFLYEDHVIICDHEKISSFNFGGELEWAIEFHDMVNYCEFDRERNVAACIAGEQLIFVDIAAGEKMTEVTNTQEYSFSGTCKFSEDGSRFAVSHLKNSSEEGEMGFFSVYDLKTGGLTTYTAKADFVTALDFSSDGNMVVVSHGGMRELNDSQLDSGHAYVEKINSATGEVFWTQEIDFLLYDLDAASIILKARKYEDEAAGVTYDQVLLSVDRTAYTWDAATGALVAQVNVPSGIREFLVSTASCFGYLAESNGTIDIVDMNTGTNYSASAIETGKEIKDVYIQNGVLVVRSYASPELTMMKYQEGAGIEVLETYDSDVDEMYHSPNETYYAVGNSENGEISFYQTKENALVSRWNREACDSCAACGFMGEETFVYVDTAGLITFVDVVTGETEQLAVCEKAYDLECDLNEDCTKALIIGADGGNDTFWIVDLQKKEILVSGGSEENMITGVLAEDGSKAYCNTGEKGLYVIDAATGETTPLDRSEYQMVKGTESQRALAVSKDGGLLAVSCVDGVLRVLDTKTLETVAEIPFASAYRRFICFSEDGKEIMLQGDDYYFKVYDLEQGQFSHIEADQFYQISEVVMDEDTGTISLLTSVDMKILESDSYEKLASVENGLDYLPKTGAVFCGEHSTLYRFPYMTLDMLLAEAEEQFAGKTLSPLERTQYNVE